MLGKGSVSLRISPISLRIQFDSHAFFPIDVWADRWSPEDFECFGVRAI